MRIIAEVGSSEYYELRAIEEVHAARSMRLDPAKHEYGYTVVHYMAHITKSIQLLVLAGLTSGSNQDD